MADVYQIVTDRIVSQLEQGVIPWRMPWNGGFNGAVSYTTGRPYSFLNQMLLGESGEYLTFNQVKTLGGNVKKGAMSLRRLGIDCDKAFTNSVGYIQSWLKKLRDDKKFVVWAAGKAEQAVKYMFNDKEKE